MSEDEMKAALEDAWHRWLISCQYAQEHKNIRFFKHFCKYIVAIWNKADADAQLLQQFFIGTPGWSDTITPKSDNRMQKWMGNMSDDIYSILLQSDAGLSEELQTFLCDEYMRVGYKTAVPLHTQFGLAVNKLPEKRFSFPGIMFVDSENFKRDHGDHQEGE